MKCPRLIGTVLAVLLACAVPAAAFAQSYLPDFGADLSIEASPTAPQPGETVTLTAFSSLLDLSAANLTWTANGKTILEGQGQTRAQVQAGAPGEQSTITVRAESNGESAQASVTLIPETVDLLVDAASYVPPFYRGRSLPSPGGRLRLEAIPHIATPAGTVSADNLIYTWRQDGEVLGSLSGRGRSSAIVPAPALFGASTISVDARTADGAYGGSATVQLPSIDPDLTLYVDHPLFGIEYYDALSDSATVPDLETTLAVVPYFASALSLGDPSLSWRWTAGGTPLAASSTDASEITVSGAGLSGPVSLSLSLTSNTNFSLDAQHTWRLGFAR